MKHPNLSIVISFLFCLFNLGLFPKLNSQTLPPFKMLLSDNSVFSAVELPKDRPLILIYFDPDCDHCQKLMDEVFKKIKGFNKAEMVMVTFKSLGEVASFEKRYGTHKFKNIRVGTEGTSFQLRRYYDVMTMPFTALYDKKGKLNYVYRAETSVNDLLSRLKNLN